MFRSRSGPVRVRAALDARAMAEGALARAAAEEEFLRQATLCLRYGAAAIVMAFDEQGQADTFERKTAICERAYRLLVDRVGFPPEDIIFDPNVFAVATGIEEHDRYALDFIEAVATLRELCPHAHFSGGLSNLSFSFRGNETVRRAMHSVFLYHAIPAGLDMAIVNAGQLDIYDQIDPVLREACEDVILMRRPDATLRGWVLQPGQKHALIYFGGNAEDVSRNLPEFAEAFPDYAVYLLNYRGFGGSGGSPSETAIAEDALALFDQVYASHPQVAVVGRSLGSGVAVRLASQRPVQQLILVTPYNSLEEIAARQYPWVPVKWLLKERFESGKYAAHIRVPTLLLAASDDEVIPRASTQHLLENFPQGVAVLRVVPDSGHNSISDRAQYLQWMGDVLNR